MPHQRVDGGVDQIRRIRPGLCDLFHRAPGELSRFRAPSGDAEELQYRGLVTIDRRARIAEANSVFDSEAPGHMLNGPSGNILRG